MLKYVGKFKRRSINIFVVICFSLVFAASASACRMWGFISDAPQTELLMGQLSIFRLFGDNNTGDTNYNNPNGWAIGYFYPGSPNPFVWPIIRRGGPRAVIDPDYPVAVNEVAQVQPLALLAHVRRASTGVTGVPNPHPFTQPGLMFCHNGTIDQQVLRTLITEEYLAQHPLDYTNPTTIDSELFFVYLMKVIRELTGLPSDYDKIVEGKALDDRVPVCTVETAIKTAISNLDIALAANNRNSQLTFLLSNGKKLWACRYDDTNNPSFYTLRYQSPEGNAWTAVASRPVSNGTWHEVPMYHLMTFAPNQTPLLTWIPHQP